MPKERGNILFLILLAIVLFAALSYAVTNSMRGGGKDASGESAEAKASALLNYMANMDSAIMRMRLTGGYADYQINFWYKGDHYAVFSNQSNSNCTQAGCRVFDPAGGGVPVMDAAYYKDVPSKAGQKTIMYDRLPGVGTNATDVIFLLSGMSYDVCMAINAKAGLPMQFGQVNPGLSPSGINPYSNGSVTPFPVGSIPAMSSDWSIPAQYPRAKAFCFCQYGNEAACRADNFNPQFAYILMER